MCSCWFISGSFRSNSQKRWWQNCELVASQTQNAQTECQEFRLGKKKKRPGNTLSFSSSSARSIIHLPPPPRIPGTYTLTDALFPFQDCSPFTSVADHRTQTVHSSCYIFFFLLTTELTSMPASSRVCTVLWCPFRAARWSGVCQRQWQAMRLGWVSISMHTTCTRKHPKHTLQLSGLCISGPVNQTVTRQRGRGAPGWSL